MIQNVVAEVIPPSAPDAVERLSLATGQRYQLVGRLAGGETGAHEVLGPDSQRLVAKWELDPSSQIARRQAVVLTSRLRDEADWPVPRQHTVEADGCLFVIQEHVAGSPIDRLTHGLVDELLDLHRRRLGLERVEDASPWPQHLIETLTTGGTGYCLHEPLRRYDARSAALVTRVERIGREVDPADLTGHDIVHWDFHPGNLLQLDGSLAAVVDTDFVRTGDAAFDLVTLAMTSLTVPCEDGIREQPLDLAIDRLDEAKRRAYVGHLLVRFLDWPLRRHRPDDVEFWLSHADRLLPD